MSRHSLCAALCTVALTLSPALTFAQATKAAPKAAAKAAPKAGAVKTVNLTGSDNMKFAPAVIRVKAGDTVKVNLKTVSTMPKMAMAHNFVLLKAGTDPAAVATASAMARPTFIAPKFKSQIIASTPLAGGGETVSVEFTAPAAGKYTFICTFPGHFQGGMVGQLIVE